MPRRGQHTRTSPGGPGVGLDRESVVGRHAPRAEPLACCVCGSPRVLYTVRACGFCRAHRDAARAAAARIGRGSL